MKAALALAGLLAIPMTAMAQTTPAPKPPPPACQAPENRQFDFWVGRWDVYQTGQTKLVAHSLVENLYGGCAIRENWMPLGGAGGGSLNSYVPAEKAWRQTWVDSSGSRVEFVGGFDGKAMVLTGPWAGSGPKGEDGIVRMTYSKNPDGSVRQFGEVSIDKGATWTVSFDLTYRRSSPVTPLGG